MELSTKARGDVAEYQVVAALLERGHNVLMPCGDRLPYDVAVDDSGRLLRMQVRRAWWSETEGYHCVDVRRSQTNRKVYKHTKHATTEYDFLIAWVPGTRDFYIIPSKVADTFASNIALTETGRGKAVPYRNAWQLLDAGMEKGIVSPGS